MTAKKKKKKSQPKPKHPIEILDGLLEELRDLTSAPGRDSKQRAIHDAWRIILKPRKANMVRRLKDFLKDSRWEYGDDEVPDYVLPSSWNRIVKYVSTPLYAELVGCLRQYYSIRLRWTQKIRFGAVRGKNAPVGKKANNAKQKAAAKKAEQTARDAAMEAYASTAKKVMDDWADRRERILALLEAFQGVVVELARREEDRISVRIDRLVDPGLKKSCKKILRAAQGFRREAGRADWQDFGTSGTFSRRMRGWNGRRNLLRKKLDG